METTNDLIFKLFNSLKRYFGLQGKFLKLELTEKLTVLLTALILGSVIFVIGLIAVIFLALTASAVLIVWLGSAIAAYAIVAVFFILLCLLIYLKKNEWIVAPLAKFFSNLLLDNIKKNDDKE